MKQIRLYLLGEKGFDVLTALEKEFGKNLFEAVVSSRDKNVVNDFYEEIRSLCKSKGIPFFNRTDFIPVDSKFSFAIGWRYLISNEEKLIILHDSLLPRYRGFNPLVTALINGDKEVGVTALFASDSYDCGEIIEQQKISISYPIKISEAITKINSVYVNIILSVTKKIVNSDKLTSEKQNESQATYSLWRDEEDYLIDWSWDAQRLARMIAAVGTPYKGAQTYVDGKRVVIEEAIALSDLVIENRVNGKVILVEDSYPIIVCGTGLLKIQKAYFADTNESLIPLKKFRSRFSSEPGHR